VKDLPKSTPALAALAIPNSGGLSHRDGFIFAISRLRQSSRMMKVLLPQCDVDTVCNLACAYFEDTGKQSEARKDRKRKFEAPYRRRISEINSQVRAHPGSVPVIEHSGRELQHAQERLQRSTVAFATKPLGVSGDLPSLFLLREYLSFHTSQRVGRSDLTAIVEAAMLAKGYKSACFLDPDVLHRKLRNFERKRPDLCQLLRDVVQNSGKSMEKWAPQQLPDNPS
jgi:hypothetical protein